MATGYSHRGEAYGKQDQYDKAIADLTKVVELLPNNPFGHTQLCVRYRQRGNVNASNEDYQKAISACSKAISFGAAGDMALANRGLAHNGLKEYDKAIHDFSAAIAENPKFTTHYEY